MANHAHQQADMTNQQTGMINQTGMANQVGMTTQQAGMANQQHRRSRSHSRSRSRVFTPGLGDSEDYETLGSETETEHGGLSSMTESSNQLDGQSTLRDHTLVYVRGPVKELKSGCESVYGPKPKTILRERPNKDKSRHEESAFEQRIHHSECDNLFPSLNIIILDQHLLRL